MTRTEPSLAEIAASPNQDMAWLYVLYLRGDRPDAEREAFLREAAELGIVPAMHDYAEFLEDERDQPEEAERWFAAAAAAGYAPAVYRRSSSGPAARREPRRKPTEARPRDVARRSHRIAATGSGRSPARTHKRKGESEMAGARADLIEALADRIGTAPLTPGEIESILALAAVAAHGTGDRTTAPLVSFLAGIAAAGSQDRAATLDEIRRQAAELVPKAE